MITPAVRGGLWPLFCSALVTPRRHGGAALVYCITMISSLSSDNMITLWPGDQGPRLAVLVLSQADLKITRRWGRKGRTSVVIGPKFMLNCIMATNNYKYWIQCTMYFPCLLFHSSDFQCLILNMRKTKIKTKIKIYESSCLFPFIHGAVHFCGRLIWGRCDKGVTGGQATLLFLTSGNHTENRPHDMDPMNV